MIDNYAGHDKVNFLDLGTESVRQANHTGPSSSFYFFVLPTPPFFNTSSCRSMRNASARAFFFLYLLLPFFPLHLFGLLVFHLFALSIFTGQLEFLKVKRTADHYLLHPINSTLYPYFAFFSPPAFRASNNPVFSNSKFYLSCQLFTPP